VIVPSIDLQDGKVVQLVGGRERALAEEDVMGWGERLSVFGEIAVVDLDAAMGRGDNDDLVRALCRRFRCRVGGGVRSEARARELLAAGATRLMVGTAATPDLLSTLPRDVWIACLDHKGEEVVDEGWTRSAGEGVLARAERLAEYVNGFLVTNVGVEGSMKGPEAALAKAVADRTGRRVTAAGGARNVEDVVALHEQGLDAQVGMAIYTGALDPAEAFVACVNFEKGRHGELAPTFVTDERGRALMCAWSSRESLLTALRERRGIYHSRSRGELWRKGETSGNTQRLIRAEADCDADALRFVVDQAGPTCHLDEDTCYGPLPFALADLEGVIERGVSRAGYTSKLAGDPRLARRKVMEEAYEVVDAASDADPEALAGEMGDLLYHALTLARTRGVTLRDVESALAGRRKPEGPSSSNRDGG